MAGWHWHALMEECHGSVLAGVAPVNWLQVCLQFLPASAPWQAATSHGLLCSRLAPLKVSAGLWRAGDHGFPDWHGQGAATAAQHPPCGAICQLR